MTEGFPKSEGDKISDTESAESASFHWRMPMRSTTWRPPTDIYETEDMVYVRVEIAGMREEDFIIELNGRELNVRGIRQDQAERRSFHQMEIHFGEFALSLELPFFFVTDQVQAVYSNGFLLVSLPKARPRQIQINE
jgi:HSP20 family protein